MVTPFAIINAVNQLLIQIFDVFGAFLAWIGRKLRVLHQMRNVSGCFAGFSSGIGRLYHARGVLCKPGRGRGYPQKYPLGTKSHFCWMRLMRLNSEKLKNPRKTKKTRPESGVWWGRVPLWGRLVGWDRPSTMTTRNRVDCNGTVADLGGPKPRFL